MMLRAAKQISMTIIFTVILVLTIALCISATAISQAKNDHRAETEYYRDMEQEYVRELRSFLGENGYRNSGVTMTEVVETDGSRNYTVTIHHQRMKNLSMQEKEALLTSCKELEFVDGTCSISHKFLETD